MAYATQTLAGFYKPAETTKALWSAMTERFTAYRSYRQTLTELRSLSDRELNDLGLNKSMLKCVAMEAVYDM